MYSRFLLAIAALAPALHAQDARAVRLAGDVRVDGRLTEIVWRSAPAITRLIQREPEEGAPAIDSSEIRFAYDDDALYVGARMYSAEPDDIRALVTRRDQEGISEFIAISLDTYLDRRTAYSFGVTPAGVRLDFYHASDSDDGDSGYDPVWEARARVDSLGWTAEMRIPFNQLRFSPRNSQVWGLNVIRRVPARNEDSYWMLIRRDENGWASRMGRLVGIEGIRPSHRVEVLPYVAAESRLRDVTDPDDPFQHPSESEARAGADFKLGLGPNLTLDATLNPDFGQVEGDPAVVNLSAFEIFFDEKRPFFLEGASLLDRRGLFYSRRIGASPPGDGGAQFAERRANSTILGAAKLTGRLPSRLSIAALTAVTDREVVRNFDPATSSFGRAEVAPQTLFAAASAQQEFGSEASTVLAMLTGVARDVETGTPLADLVPRNAVSGLVETRLRWGSGKYDFNVWLGGTSVQGDTAALLRLQRSSRRYFQRPDADHIEVDPTLTTLRGATFGMGHSRLAGRHWLWDIDYTHVTPGFEPNDIGAYGSVDSRFSQVRLRWRETQPASWYRAYSIGAAVENGWTYDWMRRFNDVEAFANATLPNFWSFNSDFSYELRGLSDRLTRGGPIMATPAEYGVGMELRNRDGARNEWDVEYGYRRDENGGHSSDIELGFAVRPGTQLEVRLDPEWSRDRDTRQYILTTGGGPAATFGNRYVFSTVDVSEVSARVRANYTFTPNFTLETYIEPFAASGRFHSFGELAAPRTDRLRLYGTDGTTITRNADGSHTVTDGAASFDIDPEDFNVRSFRSNLVLRWEWRAGSTLYLVWQQDREADRLFRAARPADLFDAFNTRGDNFFAVKMSYWLGID